MPEKTLTYTIRCVECGRTAQNLKPLKYWLCPSCKVKLEATPKKVIEHAIKAAEQNKEVRK